MPGWGTQAIERGISGSVSAPCSCGTGNSACAMPPGCVIGPVNIDVPVARYEFPVINPVPDTLTSVLVARMGLGGVIGSGPEVTWPMLTSQAAHTCPRGNESSGE